MSGRAFVSRFFLAASLVFALATPASAQMGTGRQILVGYYDAKPSCWRDQSSKPAGIFIDVAKAVAARRGWELSFVYDTWDGLLDRLKTNRVDFVPAIVRTPARESFAVFTEESVMTDWGTVYARSGGQIRSILDLDGRKVGALENDYWFSGPGSLRSLAASFGLKPKYSYYPDYSSLFAALGKGEVDAVPASNSLGIVWEPLQPIAPTPVVYNPMELRFAAPLHSQQGALLVKEMDAEIRSLRASKPEFLRQILSAYAVPVRQVFETPLWVTLALALLAAVLVAIVIVLALQSRALRRAVAETKAAIEGLGEARAALERSLGEKELLVHELSHRVKNNLQLVLSLTSLMADDSGERSAGLFGELREKLFAISRAEDELISSGGIGQAAMESLVGSILGRAAQAESRAQTDFSARIDLRGRTVAAAAVIPTSLIASELLAEARRRGVPGGRAGTRVRVETTEEGGGEIEVSDEGSGFAEGLAPGAPPSLGLLLVAALASQLDGSVEPSREPRGGARVLVRVPPSAWSASAGGEA